MAGSFENRLRAGPPLVADGGMGVVLSAAVPGLRCPEEANLRAPEAVVSVHVSFINAGAELIETNTFGANRRKLAQHFLEEDFERINSTAVKLARDAREVAGREVLIGASIGPLGDVELRPEDDGELFAEQALILEGRGADLFLLETFYDLHELEVAVHAVRSVSSLPIVALMSFDSDGVTLAGVAARDAATRLRELPVQAFGANHGRGPAAALNALAEMGGDDGAPLAALPNVGLASMAGARVSFPHATPEYFADFAATARSLGARLIGGCCGTTPPQIAAIRAAMDENRTAAARSRSRERTHEALPAETEGPTELARLFAAKEFVVSVQLDPPLGGNVGGLLEAARVLKESGRAHLVDVNDNPRARARMSGMIASVAIRREAGIEVLPHLTPRDSTIAGLESLLLGSHAEGIRNVLAVTGDPPEAGDYPGTGAVYDVDAIGLVELITRLNEGDRLPPPCDRRAHVVLHRRCREPDRGRPRPRGRALPAEDRGGRSVRDDADPVRHDVPRPVPGAARRRVTRFRCSWACGRSSPWSWRCASTTRRPGSSFPIMFRSATGRRARTPPTWGRSSRAS